MNALVDGVAILSSRLVSELPCQWIVLQRNVLSANWFVSETSRKHLMRQRAKLH